MFFIQTARRWLRDSHRNIFWFKDGARYRYCDPVVVGSRLEEVAPDYQDLLTVLAKKPQDMPVGPIQADMINRQRDCIKKLSKVSRSVFNLKDMTDDGDGFTDGEAVNVLARYFLFMEELARESMLFRDSQRVESVSPTICPIEPSADSGTVEKSSVPA